MTDVVRIGLVDGPLPADGAGLIDVANFSALARPESAGAHHAAAVAGTIRFHCQAARFANAVIFGDSLATSRDALVDAVTWLLSDPPDVLHCSFGLPTGDDDVAAVFADAVRLCPFVVATAPARGRLVYPAAFPGVIAVSGDARCGPDEWSWLNTGRVDFGAHVVAATDPRVRGASAAAAHITGLMCARLVASGAARDPRQTLRDLQTTAQWQGPERRL